MQLPFGSLLYVHKPNETEEMVRRNRESELDKLIKFGKLAMQVLSPPSSYEVDLAEDLSSPKKYKLQVSSLSLLAPQELHAWAVACCIELHAYKIFKSYFTDLQDIGRQWKSLPPPKADLMFVNFDFQTSEGWAFYFRFFGNHSNGDYLNAFKGEKFRYLKLAAQSTNEEIRSVAEKILLSHRYRAIKERACLSWKEIDHLTVPLNRLINNQSAIKEKLSLFTSFRKTLLFTNAFLTKCNSTEDDDSIPWFVSFPSHKEKEAESLLSSLENDIKNERSKLFEKVHQQLIQKRDKSRGRLLYTTTFLRHSFDAISIQFNTYLSSYQECFFAKEKVAKKEEKPRLAPSAPAKQSSQNTSKKRTKKKAARPSIISQPKVENKAIETPQKPPIHFTYAWRVAEWFKPSPIHLEKDSYKNLSEHQQFMQILYHAFSLKVEDYIPTHGKEMVYVNPTTEQKERLICIAGEIHVDAHVERGIYTFCIGENGELYHRHFTKKKDEMMYHFATNIFYEKDFPPLKASLNKKPSTQLIETHEGVKITTDELTGATTIYDPHHLSVKYVLFQGGGNEE
ncbi:putative uncharacterized protein [Parachlamydia acanthamoebae UV-7]|uniref:Uncharacterized protein n=2 Tax=Parachlamydia acanthamoebae TaxID=83552 RepID=F8L1V2_PARAV|nr:hypothetical protein [Parachlamydia acanthamoebae]KIA77045.1 hypothetical protein DB43_GW00130 [Parachlamydia acanthamoebae]CCB87266.1 putative uncharacterized protein [Parachlamydia acanthamoebae UV-7]